MFRTLVEVQPRSSDRPPTPDEALGPLAAPARAVQRTYPGAPHSADAIELERMPRRGEAAGSGAVTPRRESEDLERSRPTTPEPAPDAVEAAGSVWHPSMNRFRLLAVCLANLGNALSDSAAGALIPYMEKCAALAASPLLIREQQD